MPVIKPLGSRSPLGPPFDFSPVPRATDSPAGGTGNWFVRSLAVGSGTGRNWLNAFTTLSAAATAAAAGDQIWVSEDHAESQGSTLTITFPGTITNPTFIACVNHLGSIPPGSADLRNTASVATTGNFVLTVRGVSFNVYGIAFICGSGANSASLVFGGTNVSLAYAERCTFQSGGTSGGGITIGTLGNCAVIWNNCTVQFGSTAASIKSLCQFTWRNTASAITGATIPTSLFTTDNGADGSQLIDGVDFSALGTNTLMQGGATPFEALVKNCQVAASAVLCSAITSPYQRFDFLYTDSAAGAYRQERYRYQGTLTQETTIIRTGGASDGVTPISWRIVTASNAKWAFPFEAFPIPIWNNTVGSPVTVTVEGIWGSTNLPQTDDIWIEVEYLGASGNPLGSFQSASKADFVSAGSVQTSSSASWGGSTTPFNMSVTFTPQQKGVLYTTVKAAKASTTFYIDPKVTLS